VAGEGENNFMKTRRTKTFSQTKESVVRKWHLLDAKGKVLGRLASEIATILSGKSKPTYTPHIDGGDYVVLINAGEVAVTRGKENKKIYTRHSNYPGGFRQEVYADLLKRKPEAIIRAAVKGMLPDNRLRDDRLVRLKVFAGAEHSYHNYIK
jgi:large subunit ribosomal protein L13